MRPSGTWPRLSVKAPPRRLAAQSRTPSWAARQRADRLAHPPLRALARVRDPAAAVLARPANLPPSRHAGAERRSAPVHATVLPAVLAVRKVRAISRPLRAPRGLHIATSDPADSVAAISAAISAAIRPRPPVPRRLPRLRPLRPRPPLQLARVPPRPLLAHVTSPCGPFRNGARHRPRSIGQMRGPQGVAPRGPRLTRDPKPPTRPLRAAASRDLQKRAASGISRLRSATWRMPWPARSLPHLPRRASWPRPSTRWGTRPGTGLPLHLRVLSRARP